MIDRRARAREGAGAVLTWDEWAVLEPEVLPGESGPDDLARQFAEAAALAAEYAQPAYVLAAAGDEVARAGLWPEVLPMARPRIAAIVLPDGAVFARERLPGVQGGGEG